MRWKEKKKLIKIKKMNKRDYTTEEHRVSQRIFFPHHTKDENPVNSVYSVVSHPIVIF